MGRTITVTVSNNIRVRGALTPLRAEITKRLTVDNPEYVDRKRRKKPTWGIDTKLKLYSSEGADLILPRGFQKELWDLMKGRPHSWHDTTTMGKKINFGAWSKDYAIREAQLPCLNAIRGRSGCLIAPAGSGKTIMGLRAIYENGAPALWITHTIDLLVQTTERAYACMPDIGRIGKIAEGVCDYGDGKLIVATVQTLQSKPEIMERLNDYIGTLVVDECHHCPSSTFIETVSQSKAHNILGLTASPERKDGLECYMYAAIGPKLYEINRQGLYDSGRLIKPAIKFHYTDFKYDPASVRNEINSVDAGGEELDYRDVLDKLIADEARLQLIVRNVSACDGYQLVISDSIEYCHAIADLLRDELRAKGIKRAVEVVHGPLQRYGWRVARSEAHCEDMMQDGVARAYKYNKSIKRWQVQVANYTDDQYEAWNISTAQRKEIMKRASERKIDILIATGQLVQEGLDMPHLNHGHLVTPKKGDVGSAKNGASVEQAVGRLQRPDPKNPNKVAVWHDYVDDGCGVLKAQYHSRRKVYERLGLSVPRKPKTKSKDIEAFLHSMSW